jgi:phosphatidylglycerophosphatase A
MRNLVILLASMFGIGYIPVAPATAASAVMAALLYFLGQPSPAALAFGLPVLFLAGVVLSGRAESIWGHDAGKIVFDEIVGFLVTVALVRLDVFGGPGGGLLLAFFLFRFFDIVKPFPAGRSQGLPAGWGVMADDVIAGVYANLTLRLLAGLLAVR